MDTPQPPLMDSAKAETSSLSLTDRLTDIFFSPGEVFDDIKIGPPKVINWILPLLLAIGIGMISAVVIFSQPTVIAQIRQAQSARFEKMVKQGKMTQEQADQIQDSTEKMMTPKLFKISAVVASLFIHPAKLFLVTLVVWLLARFAFHSQMSYMQGLEMTGLATLISIVGALVTTFLVASFGDTLATLSPALLIDHRDILDKTHMTLAKLDIFELWFVGLIAYGIARMSGTQWFKPAIALYALWALLSIVPIWVF